MLKRLSHVCLGARDPVRTIAFYRDVLGCAVAHEFQNAVGELYGAMLHCGDGTFIELFRDAGAATSGGPFRHLCFEVVDIEATAARLRASGFECNVRRGRTDRVLQFFIHDPDGTMIEFHEHDAESALYPWVASSCARRPAMNVQEGLLHRTDLLQDLGITPSALADRRVLDVTAHAGNLPPSRPDRPFDIVLCDRLVAEAPNPEEILSKLSAALAPGGLLVVGCADHLLQFPGTIRRLLARSADSAADPLAADTVIPVINVPETIAVLAAQFLFQGSSPRFASEGEEANHGWGVNAAANDRYWRRAHTLLAPHLSAPMRPAEVNQRLYDLCTKARAQVAAFERSGRLVFVERTKALLADIADDVRGFAPVVSDALLEAADLLAPDGTDPEAMASATRFTALLGEGRQRIHLSFTKNASAS